MHALTEYVTSLLLDVRTGLLNFVRRNISTRNSVVSSSSAQALDFLVTFMDKAKSALQPYLGRLLQLCEALSKGGGARVKCAAISLILNLIKPVDYLDTSSLNIRVLFETFSFEFRLPTHKVPGTVKGSIMELLSAIARYYPDQVQPLAVKVFLRNFIDMISKEFRSDNADNSIVSGGFMALTNLLHCSLISLQPSSPETKRIYDLIKIALQMPEDLARYYIPLAVMHLLNEHITLFSAFVLEDYEFLNKSIFILCQHQNRDLQKQAYRSMESLLKQVKLITLKTDENALPHRSSYRKMNWTNCRIIFANVDKDRLVLHLPSFIQAYTYFIEACPESPPAMMHTLATIANVYIFHFTQLISWARLPGVMAIQQMVKSLYRKGEGTLRRFLSKFFYTSLISTCTEKSRGPGENTQCNYQELMYFWQQIMTHRYFKNDDINEQLQTILYDEFITGVLTLIKTFNLDVKKVTKDEDTTADATDETQQDNDENEPIDFSNILAGNLEPVNQNDFILFQNLIEFWTLFLPQLNNARMPDWIDITGVTLVRLSMEKPLISGFYRMLATILTIADEVHLFYGCKERYEQWSPDDIKTDLDTTYGMFYDYLHRVWHCMKQFKDELWVACLRLILSNPLDFFDLSQLVSPLQTSLRLGLSYYPLAAIALDTLEVMMDPNGSMYKQVVDDPMFLTSLLPCFNDYLMLNMSSSADAHLHADSNSQATGYKKHTNQSRRFQYLHRKATRSEMGIGSSKDGEWDRQSIQVRVMRILGHLGGFNKQLLTADSTLQHTPSDDSHSQSPHDGQTLVAWDPERRLTIHLPFPNAGMALPMGKSQLRNKKGAFQARDNRDKVLSKFHRLYQHVFPTLVRLAIDVDQVVREMFRAQVFQLIHWLTNNAQYESPDTILLLQTCLDASGGTSSAALRDFGSDCIYEFVKWSIKQTDPSSIKGPMNVKSLFKRLYHMAIHPSSTKRVGASLIFNRIYRLVREEDALVNEYTFELLYHFFFSLRLAEDDQASLGSTQQQARESISHLKRILRVKAEVFLVAQPQRRPFPGAEAPDMQSVVRWSFDQLGQPQRQYAKVCIDFFSEFVLRLPGITTKHQWLSDQLDHNRDYLVDLVEKSTLEPATSWHLDRYLSWQSQLQIALDAYVWLLEREILDAESFADQWGHPKSQLKLALVELLKASPQDVPVSQDKVTLHDQIKAKALCAYNVFQTTCLLNMLLSTTISGTGTTPTLALSIPLVLDVAKQPEFHAQLSYMLLLPSTMMDQLQCGETAIVPWLDATLIRTTAARFLRYVQRTSELSKVVLPALLETLSQILSSDDIALLQLDEHSGKNGGEKETHPIQECLEALRQLQALDLIGPLCKTMHSLSGDGPSTSAALGRALFKMFLTMRPTSEPQKMDILGEMMLFSFELPEVSEKQCRQLLVSFYSCPLCHFALTISFLART
ncbi:hypothetical protein DM01DRAFT_1289323 [Hesseltinella vesiculosa]|uniref:Uncharacterized protein n=1 Tax=Hesseltinella vesiculosa TaxID=101127 RepID=A0A1X2GEA7_9FUNG|nr:hypothetical protein DM01DRAFT_1289323 [Hesseltinella vesiculosa]